MLYFLFSLFLLFFIQYFFHYLFILSPTTISFPFFLLFFYIFIDLLTSFVTRILLTFFYSSSFITNLLFNPLLRFLSFYSLLHSSSFAFVLSIASPVLLLTAGSLSLPPFICSSLCRYYILSVKSVCLPSILSVCICPTSSSLSFLSLCTPSVFPSRYSVCFFTNTLT